VAGRIWNLRADPSAPKLAGLLERDPAWAAYLIADLAPPYAQHSTWFMRREAIVLLYRGFPQPVLTVLGPAHVAAILWREALAELPAEPFVFAVCREEHRVFVDRFSPFIEAHPMFRMRLDEAPPDPGAALELGSADAADVRALYHDGSERGEIPDFFQDAMLDAGVYRGLRDAGELVAVAGTHVLTPKVAAIGNVYVRHDARGRGLGGRVTAAVALELRRRGIKTIVLNVNQKNVAAIRTYQRLGFVVHGKFEEGFARPVRP
jgi:ribosomal protein S18 acetylase RimI-like enzyme